MKRLPIDEKALQIKPIFCKLSTISLFFNQNRCLFLLFKRNYNQCPSHQQTPISKSSGNNAQSWIFLREKSPDFLPLRNHLSPAALLSPSVIFVMITWSKRLTGCIQARLSWVITLLWCQVRAVPSLSAWFGPSDKHWWNIKYSGF